MSLLTAGLAIASLVSGAQNSSISKAEAQAAKKITQGQRRTQGVREIDELEARITESGVEMTQPGVAEGADRIGYSATKNGFLGIGQKIGGDLQNARDYSDATDTASLLVGTSRDAIRLDLAAIEHNANAQSAYYGAQATGRLLAAAGTLSTTFVKDPVTGKNDWDFLKGD